MYESHYQVASSSFDCRHACSLHATWTISCIAIHTDYNYIYGYMLHEFYLITPPQLIVFKDKSVKTIRESVADVCHTQIR